MTDAGEQANYFVYVYCIGGVIAYVGSGSGFRMTKHLNASHNPQLSAWISSANEAGELVQYRKIMTGLTKREALRLEGRCYEKWEHTLCNVNHPYPALQAERDAAEWERFKASGEYQWLQAMLGYPDEWLEAVNQMYDRTLPREKALEYGFIDDQGCVTYGDRDLHMANERVARPAS